MWVQECSQCLPMNAAEFLRQPPLFICTHAAILSTNIWSFQLTATVQQHFTSHSIKRPTSLCSSLDSFFSLFYFILFLFTENLRLPFLIQWSALPCTAHLDSLCCDDKKMAGKQKSFPFLAPALPLFSCHPWANRRRAGIGSGRDADNDQMDHREAAATASKAAFHEKIIKRHLFYI